LSLQISQIGLKNIGLMPKSVYLPLHKQLTDCFISDVSLGGLLALLTCYFIHKETPNYSKKRSSVLRRTLKDYVGSMNKVFLNKNNILVEKRTELKELIDSINTPRIAVDTLIIKNINKSDHKAYFIWCVCRMLNHYAGANQTRIDISTLKEYLAKDFKSGNVRKLWLAVKNHKLFFPSVTEEYLYLNGMNFFCKLFKQSSSLATLRPRPTSLADFRKYMVYAIAESSYKVDGSENANKPPIYSYNDHNNVVMPYGRSIKAIAGHIKLTERQVGKYLADHPKKVVRVEYQDVWTPRDLVKKKQVLKKKGVTHWVNSLEKGARYILYIKHSTFYHGTALGCVLFKLDKKELMEKVPVFRCMPFKSTDGLSKFAKTRVHNYLHSPKCEEPSKTQKQTKHAYHLKNIQKAIWLRKNNRELDFQMQRLFKSARIYFNKRKALLKQEDQNQLQLLCNLGQLRLKKMPYSVNKFKQTYVLKTSTGKKRMNLNDILEYAHTVPITHI